MLKNLFAKLRNTKTSADMTTSKDVNSFTEFDEKGKTKDEV